MAKREHQPELEGADIEFAKDRILDGCCKRAKAALVEQAEAAATILKEKGRALERLKELKWDSYTRHGVEIVHTSIDKVSFKQVDDDNAPAGGDEE